MDTNKEKIRYIIQFFFDKGDNASQAAEIINSVYGPATVTPRITQFWFRRFRSGHFDIKDTPRSGRPTLEEAEKIVEIVKSDPNVRPGCIARDLNVCRTTVWNHTRKARLASPESETALNQNANQRDDDEEISNSNAQSECNAVVENVYENFL